MELTKQYVENTKHKGEKTVMDLVAQCHDESSKVNFILENLGHIPRDFKGQWLFKYMHSDNHKVRMAAIKNIGKLKLNSELTRLYDLFDNEPKSDIKKEIVSSIGRQRNIETKDFLIKILKDDDPKIVCQAIRALLVFKGNTEIMKRLKDLRNHKNEMICAVIEKEFYTVSKQPSQLHHTETYPFLKNIVVHGDVVEVLKSVPKDSIHLTFTSPPYYNARDYSIYPSYKVYLEFLNEVFKEVHRVTKEGRFLLINTSPIIIPRISRKHSSTRYPIPFDLHNYIVKLGWEYLDDIIWLKPESSVKNRIGGFQQHRKPLGYKPNTVTEMIMVYRKKRSSY